MKNLKKDNFIWFGTIVNTHGIKGEVRILTNSDSIEERLKFGNKFYYKLENDYKELIVNTFRFHKNFILVKFIDLENINDVLFLKNKKIYFISSNIENLLRDYSNYDVINSDETNIGRVVGMINQGPYDSIVIEYNDSIYNIPFIDKIFILKIDDNKKILRVNVRKEMFFK